MDVLNQSTDFSKMGWIWYDPTLSTFLVNICFNILTVQLGIKDYSITTWTQCCVFLAESQCPIGNSENNFTFAE